MRQSELIVEYLSRFTTNYEEDKNFGCIVTDKSIDYLYRKKLVLSVDTEWQQGDGCLFFNYRVYGELDE